VLEHYGAFVFDIESQDRVPAKLPHRSAQFAASLRRKHIAVKSFPGKGASDGAVRADQPKIKAKLLRNWQGKRVPPPGYQYDFNTLLVSAAQRCQVRFRDVKL
jgi:hypothetical protein